MITASAFAHTTPLHEPAHVIAAIDSDTGLSFILREVKVRLLHAQKTLIEPKVGIAHVHVGPLKISATIWLDDTQVLVRDMPPLEIIGRDAQGDEYRFQMSVESRAIGQDFASLSGRVLVLRASHRIKLRAVTPSVTLRIRRGLAYPFSSGVRRVRTWGTKIIESRNAFEGFYGESADGVSLDIKENERSATLTARFDVEADPTHLMDAVDGAASYALGTALDPLYSSAICREIRTVVLLDRASARSSEDQKPAPVDLRMQPNEFLQVFVAFFHYALASPGPLRAEVHGLVQDVLQTFRSQYVPHQILVTCIAIEALLRSQATASAEYVFNRQESKILRAAVNNSALGDPKKERVHALLSQVNSPSISHLFDQIIATKLLNADHKNAWKRNRSILAHGGSRDDDPTGVLSDRVILLNCFHRLLFRVIAVPVPDAPEPLGG